MASPWDDVRSETIDVPLGGRPARASPLPWMLLTVSIALTIGVLVLGRGRIEDERVRTANALKANDELHARLKALEAEPRESGETEATLKKQILGLELEKRRLQDELARPRRK
jgi:hypothetical protein